MVRGASHKEPRVLAIFGHHVRYPKIALTLLLSYCDYLCRLLSHQFPNAL
jgi:hypothetical protein